MPKPANQDICLVTDRTRYNSRVQLRQGHNSASRAVRSGSTDKIGQTWDETVLSLINFFSHMTCPAEFSHYKNQDGCLPLTTTAAHPRVLLTPFAQMHRHLLLAPADHLCCRGPGGVERWGNSNWAVAWCKCFEVLRSRKEFWKAGGVAS